MDSEPRLPQDLERTIFEMVAHDNRRTIPVLMQVARRVHVWLEHIQYNVLTMQAFPIYPFYPSCLPSGQKGKHVRHFLYCQRFIGRRLQESSWNDNIPYCYNLQDLALCVASPPPTALSDLTSIVLSPFRTVSPRGLLRLSANLSHLFFGGDVDFNHVVVKDLTHLEVLDKYPNADILTRWREGNNLSSLKGLKYLCFSAELPCAEVMSKCLEECKSLRLLLFLDRFSSEAGTILSQIPMTRMLSVNGVVKQVPEDRVVHMKGSLSLLDWMENWINGTMGGGDLWERCEAMVGERQPARAITVNIS